MEVLQQQDRKENATLLPPLRLIDLNLNCLNELFQHLDVTDLVILAAANLTNHKHLEQAFTDRFTTTSHPYEASIRHRFLQLGYADCVTNNPYCIRFESRAFRLFGELIPTVRLHYEPYYQRHNAKIEQVIMEYGMTLSEIGLVNADMSAFEDIKQPFLHVTHLKFNDGWLGPTFFELCKWFPNLRSLTLNSTKISDRRFIKQEHPNLIELSVRNKCLCRCNRNFLAGNAQDYIIGNLNLMRFLNLNAQLEQLTLFHDREEGILESAMKPEHLSFQITFDLLKFIANSLLQLHYLELNVEEMFLLRIPTKYTEFVNLRTLVVGAAQTNQLTQLNVVSYVLNKLDITIRSHKHDYGQLSEFVGQFKNIESLSILHYLVTLDDDNFVSMVKRLVNLKTLRIALHKHSFSDNLCYIIKKFDRMQTIRISCIEVEATNRDSFLNFVNENYLLKSKNWRGSCVLNEMEFKKY